MFRALPPLLLLGISAQASAAELPAGRYWIRQVTRAGPTGVSISGTSPSVTRTTSRTTCVPLELRPGENARLLELRIDTSRFDLIRYEGDLLVVAARWRSRYRDLELRDGCREPLSVPAPPWDGAWFESSGGPIFTTEAACHAAPREAIHMCRGKRCAYEVSAAAPFVLGDCASRLDALAATGNELLHATHAQAARTFAHLERTVERGGRLWAATRQDPECRVVRVKPTGDRRVRLRRETPIDDGVRVEVTDVELRPLFRSAVLLGGSFEDRTGGGGGMGAWGGHRDETLHLGHRLVVLGHRRLYTTRSACRSRGR